MHALSHVHDHACMHVHVPCAWSCAHSSCAEEEDRWRSWELAQQLEAEQVEKHKLAERAKAAEAEAQQADEARAASERAAAERLSRQKERSADALKVAREREGVGALRAQLDEAHAAREKLLVQARLDGASLSTGPRRVAAQAHRATTR